MNASQPSLEELLPATLQLLVDDLDAAPDSHALQSVNRRADTLQRRQRTRTAVGAGAIAAAVVAGGMWLRVDSDTASGPSPVGAQPDDGLQPGNPKHLPAFTIHDQQLVETLRVDTTTANAEVRTTQLFRTAAPGGPLVKVFYGQAATMLLSAGAAGGSPVDVNGAGGKLFEGRYLSLTWDLPDGTRVLVESRGLPQDQLLTFARGLQPQGAGKGVKASQLPAGLTEMVVDPAPHRETVLTAVPGGAQEARIIVRRGDDEEFATLARTFGSRDDIEKIEVLGREALQVPMEDGETLILWRHTSEDTVELRLRAPSADAIDAMVQGLTELAEDEWLKLGVNIDAQPFEERPSAPEPTKGE